MSIQNKISEIEEDVRDIENTSFTYSNTKSVPNSEDGGLTFEKNLEKKGKSLETCVLYVDIRNSVKLNEKHHTEMMGRIYTAFAKSVLKIADYHNGYVRNIIGDRVMVVFPPNDCFTNAVDCAISINHISSKVINKVFKNVDFKCGIGIDYGLLRVIKVGLRRKEPERIENKNLVWVGYPANIASRLTDSANKELAETIYTVTRNPIKPIIHNSNPFQGILGYSQPSIYKSLFNNSNYKSSPPQYSSHTEDVEMTSEEFANSIISVKDGEIGMKGGRFISFKKGEKKYSYKAILMTEAVYKGFRKANPNRDSIKKNFWEQTPHNLRNVNSKIYGGDIYWVF